jgi:2-polyprenyl-6-methoxyphenol hydroxylase-like FAD-dependent oxidoreductase
MIYDAIVVGARCGGSPTAMLLARRGHRVLLLDRAGFPSDTLSTHYIHQPGVASLARWGLLDRVTATGCPPVRHQRLAAGPLGLRAAPTPARGPDGDIADGYCIRRSLLDHILLEAAVEAGAEARTHVAVEALLRDGTG